MQHWKLCDFGFIDQRRIIEYDLILWYSVQCSTFYKPLNFQIYPIDWVTFKSSPSPSPAPSLSLPKMDEAAVDTDQSLGMTNTHSMNMNYNQYLRKCWSQDDIDLQLNINDEVESHNHIRRCVSTGNINLEMKTDHDEVYQRHIA